MIKLHTMNRLLKGRVRYVFYLSYLVLRAWQMAADRMFPLYDGIGYYVKAFWMANQPWPNAMPWKAFSFMGLRPPGPMWLALPFMYWQPSPAVFVLALSIWVLVGIELSVRLLFRESFVPWRDSSALILLFGVNVFFTGVEMYYVDGLLASIALVMVALGVSWLQLARAWKAFAWGIAAAMAVWTKPAGMYLVLSSAAGLLAGFSIRMWKRHPFMIWIRLDRRAIATAAGFAIPACLGLLTLFVTPYSFFFSQGFRETLKTHNLTSQYTDIVLTWEGLRHFHQMFMESTGRLLWYWILAGVVVVSLQLRSMVKRYAPVLAFLLISVAGPYVCIALIPLRAHRFNAPTVELMLGSIVTVLALAARSASISWHGDKLTAGFVARMALCWVWGGACIALPVQLLFVMGMQPWLGGLTGTQFHHSMQREHELFKLLEKELDAENRRPVLLALDFIREVDSLNGVQCMREVKAEPALATVEIRKSFELQMPWWPQLLLDPLTRFPSADIIFATPVAVTKASALPPEKGTTSADWRALNNAVSSRETAEWLGLRRCPGSTPAIDIYKAEQKQRFRQRRAAFIAAFPWQTEQGKALAKAMATAVSVSEIRPAERDLSLCADDRRRGALLLHAEEKGNRLPFLAAVEYQDGDEFCFETDDSGQSDGVIIELRCPARTQQHTTTSLMLAPRQRLRGTVQSLIGREAATSGTLQITVGPGQKNNPYYDLVYLLLDPKSSHRLIHEVPFLSVSK